jgi:hypothetical protein
MGLGPTEQGTVGRAREAARSFDSTAKSAQELVLPLGHGQMPAATPCKSEACMGVRRGQAKAL